MKKFLLALALCTVGFSAQASTENIVCLVNGKTMIYEDVDAWFLEPGFTKIVGNGRDIRIFGLHTCIFVKRGSKDWESEWKKAKKILERPIE